MQQNYRRNKYQVWGIHEMIEKSGYSEEKVQELLHTFSSLHVEKNESARDIQTFLHTKALIFRTLDIKNHRK